VRELDFERLRIKLNDVAFSSLQKVAQAWKKLGVAEPQTHPQETLPMYSGGRSGLCLILSRNRGLSIRAGEGARQRPAFSRHPRRCRSLKNSWRLGVIDWVESVSDRRKESGMSTQEPGTTPERPTPEEPMPPEPGTMPDQEPETAPEPPTMPDEPDRDPSESPQPEGPSGM